MERGLEYCLKPTEHEVATRCRVHHEPEVGRQEVFGQSVALDAGEGREPSDGPMGIGMEQRQKAPAQRLVLLLCRPRNVELLENRKSRSSRIGGRWKRVAGCHQVAVDRERIE